VLPLLLVALLSMGCKDALYSATTAFIARGRPLWAAIFDLLGDLASVVTYGGGGVLAVQSFQRGEVGQGLLVLGAMGIGSLAGTYGGIVFAAWMERRMGIEVPHRLRPPRVP
jgi:hypothetical protein